MLENIIFYDKKLLVFLNNLGSESYDNLWLIITKQVNWLPFFLLIFYLSFKKMGLKNLLVLLIFVAFLILVCDQSANLFKNTFQRLRPCNNPELKGIIRIVKSSSSYSFYSGHATNSMASMTFLYLILKKFYKNVYWVFIFPLVFAYSRIYLGLHFPVDIITGYAFGFLYGFLFFKLYNALLIKYPQLNY